MMNNNEFRFRVQNLSYGWCRVNMLINDKEINFNAGYLGPKPLASLIDFSVYLTSALHSVLLFHLFARLKRRNEI